MNKNSRVRIRVTRECTRAQAYPAAHNGHGAMKAVTPEPFNGKKVNFRKFQQQYGLYITANEDSSQTDRSQILLVLSLMKEGTMALLGHSTGPGISAGFRGQVPRLQVRCAIYITTGRPCTVTVVFQVHGYHI